MKRIYMKRLLLCFFARVSESFGTMAPDSMATFLARLIRPDLIKSDAPSAGKEPSESTGPPTFGICVSLSATNVR